MTENKKRRVTTTEDVIQIRQDFRDGLPASNIAMKFSTTTTVVRKIVTGVSFRAVRGWITDPHHYYKYNARNIKAFAIVRSRLPEGAGIATEHVTRERDNLVSAESYDEAKKSERKCDRCNRVGKIGIRIFVDDAPIGVEHLCSVHMIEFSILMGKWIVR